MSENSFYNSVPNNNGTPYPPSNNGIPGTPYPQGIPAYPTAPPVSMPKLEPPLDQPWYGIDIVNAVKRFFLKYATFSGRASRGEFWWVLLASYIAAFVLSFIGLIPVIGPIITVAFSLGIFIPTLSVSVRRLHDTNRSGWFLLIPYALVIVGTVIMLASFIPAIIDLAESGNIDYMSDEEILSAITPAIAGIGIAALLFIVGAVVNIVLMALPSKPEGVRFDKNYSAVAAQPYAQQAYAQQGYGQQPPYGQQPYGQPSVEQQSPTEQPPYSPMQ